MTIPEQWLVLSTLIPETIEPWIDEDVEIKPAPFLKVLGFGSLKTSTNSPKILV